MPSSQGTDRAKSTTPGAHTGHTFQGVLEQLWSNTFPSETNYSHTVSKKLGMHIMPQNSHNNL